MKRKMLDLISIILTIVLAAGFITLIWFDFMLGVKLILTSVIAGCFLTAFE